MADQSGQLCITFNGEIYNHEELREQLEARGHRFTSATDTEVILEAYRAWGTKCLDLLNGMFAFALFDSTTRRLFVARDRAGEKPLYYRCAGKQFACSSELKALMANSEYPRNVDLEALEWYLAYGYIPGGKCILRGYHKLPQGHAAVFDLVTGTLNTWRYWQLPDPPEHGNWDSGDITDELESLLLASVRRQLVADVPVGILLSGGIDSSLVTAIAARVSSSPVKTFTISFPGHNAIDESLHAKLVASHFGTQHVEMPAEAADVDLLPVLARQFDEPMADSSMLPTFLVSRLIRSEATVALGGDGGDELFGGYLLYSQLAAQQWIWRIFPKRLVATVRYVASTIPPGLTGRNYLLKQSTDLQSRISYAYLFDQQMRLRLLAPQLRYGTVEDRVEDQKRALCNPAFSLLQQATSVDFMTYLADDILVKVDRTSMLASLETRAPWLDYHLIEFAFGRVPDELKMNGDERKILPRRLAQRLLPPALDLKRKQGFGIPLTKWLKGRWGAFFRSILEEGSPDFFDRRFVQSLLAAQQRGLNHSERLFALTMFELWRRDYRICI